MDPRTMDPSSPFSSLLEDLNSSPPLMNDQFRHQDNAAGLPLEGMLDGGWVSPSGDEPTPLQDKASLPPDQFTSGLEEESSRSCTGKDNQPTASTQQSTPAATCEESMDQEEKEEADGKSKEREPEAAKQDLETALGKRVLNFKISYGGPNIGPAVTVCYRVKDPLDVLKPDNIKEADFRDILGSGRSFLAPGSQKRNLTVKVRLTLLKPALRGTLWLYQYRLPSNEVLRALPLTTISVKKVMKGTQLEVKCEDDTGRILALPELPVKHECLAGSTFLFTFSLLVASKTMEEFDWQNQLLKRRNDRKGKEKCNDHDDALPDPGMPEQLNLNIEDESGKPRFSLFAFVEEPPDAPNSVVAISSPIVCFANEKQANKYVSNVYTIRPRAKRRRSANPDQQVAEQAGPSDGEVWARFQVLTQEEAVNHQYGWTINIACAVEKISEFRPLNTQQKLLVTSVQAGICE